MTARVQINRFSVTGQRPPPSRPVGEVYTNYADLQFGVMDATPAARDLLPIRYHSEAAAYAVGSFVLAGSDAGTAIYKATAAISPGVFNNASWDLVPTMSQTDNRYLRLDIGGTVSGPVGFTGTVTLAGDPTLPLHAAPKQYVDTRVVRSGDTMTGFLTLHADPTQPLHAATMQYVGRAIANSNLFLRLTGGELSGELTVGGAGVRYTNMGGDNHATSFGWNGAVLYAKVNNTYVGTIATREFVGGAYLPLTGGNLTGTLHTTGELQAAATVRLTNSQAYFHSNDTETILQMDGGGWTLRYARATGYLWYRRGGDGKTLFAVDGDGHVNAGGNVQASAALVALGSVYARGGSVWFGAGDRARLSSDSSTYAALHFLDNYRLQFNWGTGSYHWTDNGNTSRMTLDGGASLSVLGNMSAGGLVAAGAQVTAQGGQMYMGDAGGRRILQFAPNWYWGWDPSNGTIVWTANGGNFLVIEQNLGFVYSERGPLGGYGNYVTLSDERAKTDIEPLTLGLSDILKITPIKFTRPGRDLPEIGFSAQQIQQVIPEAVRAFGHQLPNPDDPENPSAALGVSIDPIVAAMVNAMREISERITFLEAKA